MGQKENSNVDKKTIKKLNKLNYEQDKLQLIKLIQLVQELQLTKREINSERWFERLSLMKAV